MSAVSLLVPAVRASAKVPEAPELAKSIALRAIYIHRAHWDGASYADYEFGCA